MKRNKKHIPKVLRVLIAVMLGLSLATLCSYIFTVLAPPYRDITPDHLQNHLSKYRCAIQIKDVNEEYYQVESSEDFVSLLAIGQWRRQLIKHADEEILVMKSGSGHWVFYSDGTVGAYMGEGRMKKYAYYKIPSDVADRMIDYIRANGIVREAESFSDGFFDYEEQAYNRIY